MWHLPDMRRFLLLLLPFFLRTSGAGDEGAELGIAAAGLTCRLNKKIAFPADSKAHCIHIGGCPIPQLDRLQILPQILLIFLCQIRYEASPTDSFCCLCHNQNLLISVAVVSSPIAMNSVPVRRANSSMSSLVRDVETTE